MTDSGPRSRNRVGRDLTEPEGPAEGPVYPVPESPSPDRPVPRRGWQRLIQGPPLAVRCPQCRAPKGRPCRSPSGKTTTPHDVRKADLQKQREREQVLVEKERDAQAARWAAYDRAIGRPRT